MQADRHHFRVLRAFGVEHVETVLHRLQPAVACYRCQPGDSTWRALTLEVLRIEDGLITEIVVFMPDNFPAFGLPMIMDPAPEMNGSLSHKKERN